MPRPSTVDRLPKAVREKISALRNSGRTLDEIMEHLELLNVEISRSALGRHVKKMAKVSERIRDSRILAQSVVREFGDKEVSHVARTNMELLHTLIMKIMIGGDDQDNIELDAKEAMFVATALQKLSQSSKSDLERDAKVREEERKIANAEAVKAVEKVAKKNGLSADTIKSIKSNILGVD